MEGRGKDELDPPADGIVRGRVAGFNRGLVGAGLAVFLLTFLVCLPTLEFGFLNWDDDVNVYENPHVQGLSAANLRWMFTDFGHAIRYKPLSWLGWACVHALFGLNPFGYHLANTLVHSLNALLLFFILRRMTGGLGARCDLICGLAALLWSLHPMRVEPVAWVTGLPYGLALSFMLASTLLYLRASDPRRWRQVSVYCLSVACFAAAVLTYPVVLGFPALLLALDYYPLRRFERCDRTAVRSLLLKVPYGLIALVVVGFTVYGRYRFTDYWIRPAGMSEFGLGARAMQAAYVWAYYVWKPLLPVDLAPVYTVLIWNKPLDWPFVLSCAGVLLVSVVALVNRLRRPWLTALWLAHLGLLVPMLGLTERPHYPHDRYGVVNGLLWSAVAVGLLARLRRQWASGLLVLLVLACAAGSLRQQRHWRDDVAFFTHMAGSLDVNEYRNLAMLNLGEALVGQGRFEEALPCFEQAVVRDVPWVFPFDFTRLAVSHARALIALERWADALVQLRRAEARLMTMPASSERLEEVREAIREIQFRVGHER